MAPANLHADFLDLLIALTSAEAEFVLIGGWALALHGHGRGTDDLDIFVRPTPGNATRVFAALARFGAPIAQHEVTEELFAREGYGYRMGVKPHRIELLTMIDGVSFDEVWAGAVITSIGGIQLRVMGRAALLANKRAAGRPKDLADVDWLEHNTSLLENE